MYVCVCVCVYLCIYVCVCVCVETELPVLPSSPGVQMVLVGDGESVKAPTAHLSDANPLQAADQPWDHTVVVTLLSHCCYTIVTLLLHCCYTVVTQVLHCCYTVVTLLLHYCYTVVHCGDLSARSACPS
jgi:hypothetical protein